MDHLQQLLQPSGVDVEVFRFSTRNGISDLGKQPFVSNMIFPIFIPFRV